MKRFTTILCCAAAAVCISACNKPAENPQSVCNVIFDTDIGNDIDDAEALVLLNQYIEEGRINLLGICLNKHGDLTARYVDLVNTWYGHPDIPIGIIREEFNSGDPAEERYTGLVAQMAKEDGSPLFATTLKESSSLPLSHNLYRKLLAEQPDNSVTVVSVGFLTNLSLLMDTPADEYSPLTGMELIQKKVKSLVLMAGRFTEPNYPEFNVMFDIPAAQKIINSWPGEIILSPWEIGEAVRYPAESIENDYNWTPAHPFKEAYIRYGDMPYDNYAFDPTAVVCAVEGSNYFTISPAGTVTVDDEGFTNFSPCEDGRHYYLSVTPDQAAALREYFVNYLTRIPASQAK